jgi:drug/metabolite transporter (DMT)-like permease
MLVGLLLALSASAAWGGGDFLAGRSARGLPVFTVAFWSKVAGLAGLAVACLVTGALPAEGQVGHGIAAGLVGSVGIVCLYRALALGPMSIIAPITACAAAVPVLVVVAEGELPGALTSAGVVLAFAGAVASARPVRREAGAAAAVPRREGVVLAVAAAVFLGLTLTFLQSAADVSGGSALGVSLVQTATSVPVLFGIAAARGALAPPRGPGGRPVALIGVLDVGANVLFTAASARANPAAVAVLGSLYPVVTVLLARGLLHERLAPAQTAAVGIALLGVALIGAGS